MSAQPPASTPVFRSIPGFGLPRSSERRGYLREAFAIALVCALSIFIGVFSTGMHRIGLHHPLVYGGDGLSHGYFVKTTLETGWFLESPRLGAPLEADFYDYPISEDTHFVIFRLFGLVTQEYAVVLNVFYLLSFLSCALCAYLVMRRFRVVTALAIVGSLLFTMLPYHYFRLSHLFLASYFAVPIYAYFILRVGSCTPPLVSRAKLSPSTVLGVCALLIACAGTGVYYAFFACMFITVAMLQGSLRYHTYAHLKSGVILIAMIAAGVVINLLPSVVHIWKYGSNAEAFIRSGAQSELYGLKLIQLLMPTSFHRFAPLARIAQDYATVSPLTNENSFVNLGLFGAAGFLATLAVFLLRIPPRRSFLARLGSLNVIAVLYATIGGFGAVFAYTISPDIRGLNRISVFIAFFSLLATFLILQRILSRIHSAPIRLIVVATCAPLILLIGGLDQVPVAGFAAQTSIDLFDRDRQLFEKIEAALPSGASVLQLPLTDFPEPTPLESLPVYDHMRAYLHTRSTRWSSGAVKGSAVDEWQHALVGLDAPRMIRAAGNSGFDAIYIARAGFRPDAVLSLEGTLRTLLGPPVVDDPSGIALYVIPPGMKNGQPFIAPSLGQGWHGWDRSPAGEAGSWAKGSSAKVQIVYPGHERKTALVRAHFFTNALPQNIQVLQAGSVIAQYNLLAHQLVEVTIPIDLRPGRNELDVLTDGLAGIAGSGDPRMITFGMDFIDITAK